MEVEAPKSRRSSTSSVKAKTPAKGVEEDDFDASSAFAEMAPKTSQKASRRSSAGSVKAKTPTQTMEEEDVEAPRSSRRSLPASLAVLPTKTPAKELQAQAAVQQKKMSTGLR